MMTAEELDMLFGYWESKGEDGEAEFNRVIKETEKEYFNFDNTED